MEDELINRQVARRRLLRKAGAVAATVAGAGAVSAAIGSPAQAAPSGNMIIGADNDGDTTTTSLASGPTAGATLALLNDATATAGTLKKASAPLQLVPVDGVDYVLGPVGSLGVSEDGTLWSTGYDPTIAAPHTFPDFVRTGSNTTIVQSFAPVRILDTRAEYGSVGKASIMNKSILNSQGYIPGGGVLNINLDSLFVWAWAIFGNITVLAGGQAGFVTAFPAGTAVPNASNVNFNAGAILSNFAVVSVGSISGAKNAISIRSHVPARVILDIAGAVVNYPSDVKGGTTVAPEAGGVPRPRVRPANLDGQARSL